MNKSVNIVTFILLSVFMTLNVIADDTQKFKYRAYAATRIAKSLLSKKVVPDDVVQECDGSGWITHGDGHKTPCPGCPACKQKEQLVEDKKTSVLEQSPAISNEPKYYVYHFGSKTCLPCEQMKNQTWANQQVKDLMQQKSAKLMYFDAENSEHDKFFKFYQARYYPTIVLLKSDNLETTIIRLVGFQSPETMIKVLETNL